MILLEIARLTPHRSMLHHASISPESRDIKCIELYGDPYKKSMQRHVEML